MHKITKETYVYIVTAPLYIYVGMYIAVTPFAHIVAVLLFTQSNSTFPYSISIVYSGSKIMNRVAVTLINNTIYV